MTRPVRAIAGVASVALCCLIAASCGSAGADTASENETVAMADGGSLGDGYTVKVYKSPTCGCCGNWVDHLRAAGFEVEVEDRTDMAAVKLEHGVPAGLQSCHTATIGDYVFEGHIPAEDIASFLEQGSDADGLAVPGMPVGSPGMEMGARVDPYDVVAWDGLETSIYRSYR